LISTSAGFKTNIDKLDRDIGAKVEIFFDGDNNSPTVFYKDDQIVSIAILEELRADTMSPLGHVSANELSLVLNNSNRIFSPTNTESPYYNKLLPNVLIKAFIGVHVSGSYEYISLGEFRTGDWRSPSSQIRASVKCPDILASIGQKDMPMVPVIENTNIKEMFEILFQSFGLTSDDYIIDEDLVQPIRFGWFNRDKVINELQRLASSGHCFVFLNRQGKIRVKNIFSVGESVATLTDNNQIVNVDSPQKYSDTFSKIFLKYPMPTLNLESEQIVSLADVKSEVPDTTLTGITFSNAPICLVNQVALTKGRYSDIEYIKHGALDCTIKLINDNLLEEVRLTIFGQKMNKNEAISMATNAALVDLIGEKELSLTVDLIQQQEEANNYTSILLNFVGDPFAYYSADIRGNPSLEVGDVITLIDTADKVPSAEVVIVRQTMSFAGGLDGKLIAIKKECLE